jgi:hypothetical protein
VNGGKVIKCIPTEVFTGIIITDVLDNLSRNGLRIDLVPVFTGDFPKINDKIGPDSRLTADMGVFVLFQAGIQYGIGNLIAYLVRVSF